MGALAVRYGMVFASIPEHASTVVFIASTSSDQICFASSEQLEKTTCKQRALRKFSVSSKLIYFFTDFTRFFFDENAASNISDTSTIHRNIFTS